MNTLMTLPAETMNAANDAVVAYASGWWLGIDMLQHQPEPQQIDYVRGALSAIALAWFGAVVLAGAGIGTGRFGIAVAVMATLAAIGAPAIAAATSAAGVAVFANYFRSLYEIARACGAGAEAASRVVATVHAVATAAVAASFFITHGGADSDTAGDTSGDASGAWWASGRVAWSLGYLAHDLDLLLGDLRTDIGIDWATVAHHVAFAGALAAAAPRAAALTARALLAEAAVPPLYLGWWLAHSGGDRRHPYVFAAAGVATLVMFVATRVLNFALILPAVAASAGTVAGIGGAGLLSLNVWWTWRLAARVAKSFKTGRDESATVVDDSAAVVAESAVDESAAVVDAIAAVVVKPRRLRARAD
jgi:hypothetical protein